MQSPTPACFKTASYLDPELLRPFKALGIGMSFTIVTSIVVSFSDLFKTGFRRQGQHVLLAMVWIQALQMDHPQLQLAFSSRWT
jgi:hypothetical protein